MFPYIPYRIMNTSQIQLLKQIPTIFFLFVFSVLLIHTKNFERVTPAFVCVVLG